MSTRHAAEIWDQTTEAVGRTATGIVAGCIGGALASWVMNQWQVVSSKPLKARQAEAASGGSKGGSSGDDAAVKVAETISRTVADHPLSASEKKVGGPSVHYAYGTLVGGLYGGLAELFPVVGAGFGIPYATLLWFFGDEVAVPALGLSKPPTQTPPASHASALATHFVYGVALDLSRRVLRHVI